jgi:hypothetical protein
MSKLEDPTVNGLGTLWRAPFLTPYRRIVSAFVAATATLGLYLWGHYETWRLFAYLGAYALWILSDLGMIWYARSRPDGGASLPVVVGGQGLTPVAHADPKSSSPPTVE